ncbi:MAG: hypothetical protein Kow0047_18640 [Anaerolineae bacterium]
MSALILVDLIAFITLIATWAFLPGRAGTERATAPAKPLASESASA